MREVISFYLYDAFIAETDVLQRCPGFWLRWVLDYRDGPRSMRVHGIRGMAA